MVISLAISIFSFPFTRNFLPLAVGGLGWGLNLPLLNAHPHPNLSPFKGKEYLKPHQSGKI